jgi:hypothetical protein
MARPMKWPLLPTLALALATGCQAPPPPPPPPFPALSIELLHWRGTAFGGPAAVATEEGAEDDEGELAPGASGAFAVRASLWQVAAPPADARQETLLSPQVDLVSSLEGDAPLLAAPVLARDVRRGTGELPPDAAALAELRGTLAPESTVALRVAELGAEVRTAHLALEVSRTASELQASLHWVEAAAEADGEGRVPREQRLLLGAAPPLGGPPLVVYVPEPFAGSGPLALALALAPAPDADSAQAAEHAALFAAATAQAARLGRSPARTPDLAERVGLASGLRSLDPRDPRPNLVFLASEVDAPVALDLALVAEDESLAELAARLPRAAELDGLEVEAARELLAWSLVRSSFAVLAERAVSGALTAAEEAVLLRHAGELGRFPSALSDALLASGSVARLDARLVEENRVLLEDVAPAARRRAFAWLAARGLAPADFDPLAPAAARRAALAEDGERRAAEAAAESAR